MAIVIGYGNELRGDDGVGPALVRALEAIGLSGVYTCAVHQLIPELAPALAKERHAIFVDARETDDAAAVRVERIEASETPGFTGHIADAKNLLALTQLIYKHSPQSWLVSIKGTDFGIGRRKTKAATINMQRALKLIQELVGSFDRPGY
jgi:hydrogenase maturation protease